MSGMPNNSGVRRLAGIFRLTSSRSGGTMLEGAGLGEALMRLVTAPFTVCRVLAAWCAGVTVVAGVLFSFDSSTVAAERSPATSQSASNPAEPMWVNHSEPILSKHCFKCHAGEKQKGGLDLRQPSSIFAGGTDGSVVIPGRPGESPLYQRLQPGTDDHMPPTKEPQPSAEEISFVREWIAMLPTATDHPAIAGGKYVFDQTAPSLMDMATRVKWQPPAGMQPSDTIDHLIQSRWREQNISGNGAGDDRTVVRRIFLDLAGRIPTRDEGDSFLKTTEAQKRAVLVGRLLAGTG